MLKQIKFKSNHRRSTIANFTPGKNLNRFGDRLHPAFRHVAEEEYASLRSRAQQKSPRGARMFDQYTKGDTEGAAQTAAEMAADAAKDAAGRAAMRLANKAKSRGTRSQQRSKQQQGQRQNMKQRQGTSTAVAVRNNNRGGGKGFSSGRPSKYPEPSKTPRGIVGYNPFLDPPSGAPVQNEYPKFGAFYHIPGMTQEVRDNDGEVVNFGKTMLTSVSTGRDDIFKTELATTPVSPTVNLADLTPIQTAKMRVFTEAKIQAIANTNGGRAASTVFTQAMFFEYLRTGMSSCAIIAQLNALMSWDPPYAETNSCLRTLSNKMNSSTTLRVAKGALEEALAALALPRPIKEYYRELFQVYKTSPVQGGTHHMFIESSIVRDMFDQNIDFDHTVEHINFLIGEINGSNFNDYATITALLKDKTYFTYDSMRDLIPMPDSPTYSPKQATLFNNTPWRLAQNTSFNLTKVLMSGGLGSDDTAHLVSAMGTDEISCYEVAPHIQLFGSSNVSEDSDSMYFAFKIDYKNELGRANRFWVGDDNSTHLGVQLHNVIQSCDDLLDFRVTPQAQEITPLEQTYRGVVVPKGENVRLYQASIQPVVAAVVSMIYKTMDLTSNNLM